MQLDEITGIVIDQSIRIHRELGPGLLESVYEVVLSRAFQRRGLQVERPKVVRFEFDAMVFDEGLKRIVNQLASKQSSALRVNREVRE